MTELYNSERKEPEKMYFRRNPLLVQRTDFLELGERFENRWAIREIVGRGTYGQVYRAYDKKLDKDVAIKINNLPQMDFDYEAHVLKRLGHLGVFCQFICKKRGPTYNYLIMELQGPDLHDLQLCYGRFFLSTTLSIGLKMLDAVEKLHSYGFTHRDIKNTNFSIGLPPKRMREIILIDFGMVRRYLDGHGVHKQPREEPSYQAHLNYAKPSHLEKEMDRRDDLWALLYCIIECRANLPWANKTDEKEVSKLKTNWIYHLIQCNLAPEIMFYKDHIEELKYGETPDYEFIRGCFLFGMRRYNITGHEPYEWETFPDRIWDILTIKDDASETSIDALLKENPKPQKLITKKQKTANVCEDSAAKLQPRSISFYESHYPTTFGEQGKILTSKMRKLSHITPTEQPQKSLYERFIAAVSGHDKKKKGRRNSKEACVINEEMSLEEIIPEKKVISDKSKIRFDPNKFQVYATSHNQERRDSTGGSTARRRSVRHNSQTEVFDDKKSEVNQAIQTVLKAADEAKQRFSSVNIETINAQRAAEEEKRRITTVTTTKNETGITKIQKAADDVKRRMSVAPTMQPLVKPAPTNGEKPQDPTRTTSKTEDHLGHNTPKANQNTTTAAKQNPTIVRPIPFQPGTSAQTQSIPTRAPSQNPQSIPQKNPLQNPPSIPQKNPTQNQPSVPQKNPAQTQPSIPQKNPAQNQPSIPQKNPSQQQTASVKTPAQNQNIQAKIPTQSQNIPVKNPGKIETVQKPIQTQNIANQQVKQNVADQPQRKYIAPPNIQTQNPRTTTNAPK